MNADRPADPDTRAALSPVETRLEAQVRRAREGAEAMTEHLAKVADVEANTVRLRALRLQRDAEARDEAAFNLPVAAPRKRAVRTTRRAVGERAAAAARR